MTLTSTTNMMSLLNVVDSGGKYKEALEKTRAGQIVCSYISSMESVRAMAGKTQCAQQVSSEMGRVLLSKMKMDRQWLGLPAKLPRVIAFMNLSGENVLIYSENLAIIRAIVFAGATATEHRLGLGVEEMIRFAEMHDASLLLTLTLPWQSGTHSQYWEIRSMRENGEGKLVDGEQIFAVRSDEVQEGGSIVMSTPPQSRLLDLMTQQWDSNVRAVCIDVGEEGEPPTGRTSVVTEKKCTEQLKLIENLQRERKSFQQDMRELKRKHAVEVREANTKFDDALAQERAMLISTRGELDRAQTALKEERSKAQEELVELRASVLQKDEELDKAKVVIAKEKQHRESAEKEARTATETVAHEREQQKMQWQESHDSAERRVCDLRLQNSSITSELVATRDALTRKENVLDEYMGDLAKTHKELTQKQGALRCAFVMLKYGRTRFVEERKAAAKKLKDANRKTRVAEQELASVRKDLQAVTREAAEERARREAEATAVTQTVADPPITTTDVQTIAVNTEPLGDPPEVLQMQQLLDVANAEVKDLKDRLAQAEMRASNGGLLLGGDPAVDGLIERLAIESRRVYAQIHQSIQQGGMHGPHGGYDASQQQFYQLNPNAYGYYPQ